MNKSQHIEFKTHQRSSETLGGQVWDMLVGLYLSLQINSITSAANYGFIFANSLCNKEMEQGLARNNRYSRER